MSDFEFAFTLFGLLLGLTLSEGLAGFARAIKRRHRASIGVPTMLLGLLVACDVVTFWMYGWQLRSKVEVTWPLMFGGFVITGIYYVAASLIFPDDDEIDFAAHFDRVKALVLGGIVICNLALLGYVMNLVGLAPFGTLRAMIITWSSIPAALAAILLKDHRKITACLIWMIALYPLALIWS